MSEHYHSLFTDLYCILRLSHNRNAIYQLKRLYHHGLYLALIFQSFGCLFEIVYSRNELNSMNSSYRVHKCGLASAGRIYKQYHHKAAPIEGIQAGAA